MQTKTKKAARQRSEAATGGDARANENQKLVEGMGRTMAVIEFQLDGTIVAANQNFLDTMGYRLADIAGKHHSLFVDAGYRQTDDYREFWARLNRGEAQSGEFHRVASGGRDVWLRATYFR